jgi:hypothetical protein
MMGPKRGKEKVDGAIAADAATVKVKTTLARTASYMIMKQD